MEISYPDARAACVAHYTKRGMPPDYWDKIIPTDPAEVFRIYDEIQKELEESKRYRWESFTFCGLTLKQAHLIENDEPAGSQ